VTISQPHALTLQYSVAVTHNIQLLLILPIPEAWKPESSLSALGIKPGPPAQMSEHTSERIGGMSHLMAKTMLTAALCTAKTAADLMMILVVHYYLQQTLQMRSRAIGQTTGVIVDMTSASPGHGNSRQTYVEKV